MALWDIVDKHYGAPVHGLLGGAHRSKIKMCALCMDVDLESGHIRQPVSVKDVTGDRVNAYQAEINETAGLG